LGYRTHIDVSSFVDFFLINELNRNVDGYRLSTFIYKDKDKNGETGKLTLGPIWDFNLAFGNADYCHGSDIEGWAYKFNDVCSADFWLVPFWWERLLSDPAFAGQVKLRWFTLREGAWSTGAIDAMIEGYAEMLADAQNRNFQRWPVIGSYVWPNNFVGSTYREEIDYMKNWIHERAAWLDQQFSNFEDPVEVTGIYEGATFTSVFPNPFEGAVTFQSQKASPLESVRIFTFSGQLVRTLGSPKDATQNIVWDGKNEAGQALPEAVYLFQAFSSDGTVSIGKLIKSTR